MYMPLLRNVPSEQTVEVLSGHFLLAGLHNPRAWIFCPTRFEERARGFDGSLQNGKIVIIQYKRVHVNSKGSLRVDLDQTQDATLRRNFSKHSNPYVFYAFSIYRTYQDLNAGFLAPRGPLFFQDMRFVDLHDVPPGCRSLSYGVHPSFVRARRAAVPALNGDELVHGIRECPIGLKVLSEPDATHFTAPSQSRSLRASILIVPG